MQTGLIPRPAPELLAELVSPGYAYAVNCSYPNSFRVLNKRQYELLAAVNGIDDVATIARRMDIPDDKLQQYLELLSKTELIRFDSCFTTPEKPLTPTSLNFWIHTTDACNLGCSYCYISTLNTSKGMNEAVRQQLLHKFIEAAETKGIRLIRLRLAGGEPLGQFNAWKAFMIEGKEELAKAGCKLDIGFVTNLTMLNDGIIEFSKQHDISFGVSLDGVDAVHDETRMFRSGEGTFKIVDSNLRKLISNGINVSVNTVVTNLNLAGLPDLTRYLIALDVPFRYSIVKGSSINAALLDNYLSEAYGVMQEAIATGWQFSSRYQFCDLKPNELGFQTCASGFSGGAIYTNGTFKYCHVQFGKEGHSSMSIFNEGLGLLEMIGNGEHLEQIKSDDCKKCRFRSVCTSGCPVYREKGKDPQCSLYHRFIPMYYRLQAKERLRLMQQYEIV